MTNPRMFTNALKMSGLREHFFAEQCFSAYRRESQGLVNLLWGWVTLLAVGLFMFPAWMVPTQRNEFFIHFQDLLIPLSLLGACLLLLGRSELIAHKKLTLVEALLILFLGVGVVSSSLSPAPFARVAGLLTWFEAGCIAFLLSRLANYYQLMAVLRFFTVIAVAAGVWFVIATLYGLEQAPGLIHQNHVAVLLILPVCLATRDIWSSRGRALLFSCVILVFALTVVFFTKSRAVILALGSVAVFALFLKLLTIRQCPNLISSRPLNAGVRMLVILALSIVAIIASDYLLTSSHHLTGLSSTLETLAYPDEGSIGGRWRRWENALEYINSAPWLGHGLGSWFSGFDAFRHSAVPDPSGDATAVSLYVLLLAEVGLIGVVLFVSAMALIIVKHMLKFIDQSRTSNDSTIVAAYALVGWLVAVAFHSAPDFNLTLAGFAFVVGSALWRAPSSPVSSSTRSSQRIETMPSGLSTVASASSRKGVLVLVATVCVLSALHYQAAVAGIEARVIKHLVLGANFNSDRVLWRVVDQMSGLIENPLTRSHVVASSGVGLSETGFYPAGPDDPNLYIARHYSEQNLHKVAIEWFDKALVREPSSLAALLGLCRSYEQIKALQQARLYCGQALQLNAQTFDAHIAMARLAEASGEELLAVTHLVSARDALWRRLDSNDFGVQTLDRVSRLYLDYRFVVEELGRLESISNVATSAVNSAVGQIEQMPIIHSRISIHECELYFTGNMNARHNLWVADICSDGTPVSLLTNDSLSPFQLHATAIGVYFISDERGNATFKLFRYDKVSQRSERVRVPAGLLHTYSVSPDGHVVAVVMRTYSGYSLFTRQIGKRFDGAADEPGVSASESWVHHVTLEKPLDDIAWNADNKSLAVVEDSRRVHNIERATNLDDVVLDAGAYRYNDPIFSPDGKHLAVIQRPAKTQYRILVHALDGSSTQVVVQGNNGYAIDLVWVDSNQLLFREVSDNEYLVRRYSMPAHSTLGQEKHSQPVLSASLETLGPTQGVVYSLAHDPRSQAIWFAASDEFRPVYLTGFSLPKNQTTQELKFDSLAEHHIRPIQVTKDSATGASLYRIDPIFGPSDDVVIWLPGGGGGFSPRWHNIAQQFAQAGYSFIAFNYETQWSVERGSGVTDWAPAIAKLSQLVDSIKADGNSRVHMLGVSMGTKLLHRYLGDVASPKISSAIEFAPIADSYWAQLVQHPPTLLVAGANDPLFDAKEWRRQVDSFSAGVDQIKLHLLKNEGHDLRGKAALRERMQLTFEFLNAQRALDYSTLGDGTTPSQQANAWSSHGSGGVRLPQMYEHVVLRSSSVTGISQDRLFSNICYEANNPEMRSGLELSDLDAQTLRDRWVFLASQVRCLFVLRDSLFSQQEHPLQASTLGLMIPPSWIAIATGAADSSAQLMPMQAPPVHEDARWLELSRDQIAGSFQVGPSLAGHAISSVFTASPEQRGLILNARQSLRLLKTESDMLIQAAQEGPEHVAELGAARIIAADQAFFGPDARRNTVIPISVENPTDTERREGKGVEVSDPLVTDSISALVKKKLYSARLAKGDLALERYNIAEPSERRRAISLLTDLIPVTDPKNSTVWLWVTGPLDPSKKLSGEDASSYLDTFWAEVDAEQINVERLRLVSKPDVDLAEYGGSSTAALDTALKQYSALGLPLSLDLKTEDFAALLD